MIARTGRGRNEQQTVAPGPALAGAHRLEFGGDHSQESFLPTGAPHGLLDALQDVELLAQGQNLQVFGMIRRADKANRSRSRATRWATAP